MINKQIKARLMACAGIGREQRLLLLPLFENLQTFQRPTKLQVIRYCREFLPEYSRPSIKIIIKALERADLLHIQWTMHQ